MSILEAIRAAAARNPQAPALRSPHGDVSFENFAKRVDALAGALESRGIGPDCRVAIHLERSPEMLIAIFGTLASGAAYVPLDPENPVERLRIILEDSECSLLLSRAGGAALAEAAGVPRFDPEAWPQSGAPVETGEARVAYVIYTSGSTGKPKGVVVEHASLENYVSWASRNLPFQGGGVPLFGSISFDHAVTCVYPPLVQGETVILLPSIQGGRALAEALLTGRRYSYVKTTPSHFAFLNADQRAALGCSTGLLMFGGERLPPEFIAHARRDNPALAVMNHYGPTEATVGCCVYSIPRDFAGDSVPIGQPITGVEAMLAAETGELLIGGKALAQGYWRRSDLTAQAFIELAGEDGLPARWYCTGDMARRREDGNLEYLGRADDQVKILGHRIETGEIEQTLRDHPPVTEAAVLVSGDSGAIELVAAVAGAGVDQQELRRHLRSRLPAAMIPARILCLDHLPIAANGKLDRQTILRMAAERGAAPGNGSIEEQLAEKFREALGVTELNPHDDFFELGGDSMATVEITMWASDHFHVPLDPAALFEFPSVRALAVHITAISN